METDLQKVVKTTLASPSLDWLAAVNGHLLQAVRKQPNQQTKKKKTASLKVACWNIRTMQDSGDRPQRRSAFVAGKLARLDIDIAPLIEVRFARQGSLTEDEAGYTLL